MVSYPGDWEITTVEKVADINTGRRNLQDNKPNGRYKFFVRSPIVERIDVADYDCEAVLTAGDGNAGKVFHYVNGKFSAHQRVYVINNFRNINGRFFYYYFSRYFIDEVRKYTAKSTVDSVRRPMIASMLIPLPPLEEQTAIADTLAVFDRHITNLTELIAKKKAIRDGALDDLMSGRTRLEGFCGEWEVRTLGECVSEKLSYGVNAPAIPYDRKNPAYLRITDITDDGKYSDKDKKSVITSEREKYTLRYGDIVLARTGASTGKSYLYDPKDGELVYAGYLIRASIDCEKYDPRYIVSQLRTPRYWSWVASMSMRSGQPGINSKEYSSFTIPLPTLQEQTAIANTLTALDNEISSLETERAKISQIRDGAINDLLTGKVRLIHGN